MAFINQEELHWSQNTTEYIKFRNVINDAQCSHWVVWDELGTNPSQEEFLEGMKRQNLDIRRLKITGWNNHELNNGGLLNYGMSKQFYIPHLYDWDISMFKKDYNSDEDFNESELLPCPFCGGKAKYDSDYEGLGLGQIEDFVAVVCTKCGFNTRALRGCSTRFKIDAMKLWNTRA